MGALLVLAALLLVPFLLIGLVFGLLGALLKVVFVVLTLPFRIFGALLKGVFGLFAGVFGLAMGGAGLVIGLLVLVGVFVLLPLAPLLLIGAVVWLALKAFRPAAIRPV